MMGHREKLGNGWEYDWVSKHWRRLLHWRPGQGRAIKAALSRRARRRAKEELRRAGDQG